jgi:hypothetical protein
MALATVQERGITFIEGPFSQPLLSQPRDVTLVVEACFSSRTRAALLYSSNLTARFFDVSSLEAGDVLQKLHNYRMRVAVVLDSGTAMSRRFHELLAAERRDPHFQLFDTRESAVEWLAAGAVGG